MPCTNFGEYTTKNCPRLIIQVQVPTKRVSAFVLLGNLATEHYRTGTSTIDYLYCTGACTESVAKLWDIDFKYTTLLKMWASACRPIATFHTILRGLYNPKSFSIIITVFKLFARFCLHT
jgi:hypothetical protein